MSEASVKRATKEIKSRLKGVGKDGSASFSGLGLEVIPGPVCDKLCPFSALDFSHNALSAFPPEVYQWKGLKELVLGLCCRCAAL